MLQTPKLHNITVQIGYLPQVVRLVWAAVRGWTLTWMALLMVQGLLPVATVYLLRPFVDRLVAAIGTGGSWESLQPLLVVAAFMAGVMALSEVLQSAIEYVRTVQAELLQDHISGLVHAKSVAVDLAFYESPEYYDHLHRARGDASSRSLALLENGGSLLQNGLTLLAMAAVLMPYGVWLPVVLLVSTLPAFFVVLRSNQRYHRWWERTTPDRRWTQYYDLILTHSAAAAELRLFGLGQHFHTAYQAVRRRLRGERLQLIKAQNLARLGAGASALVVSGVAMAWMVWRAVQGLVTLGDLVLFYQAFQRGQGLMRSLLSNVGQIYTNGLFLRHLFTFLELPSHVVDPAQPLPAPPALRQGIRLQQVTFRYPGSARAALCDFTLAIPTGQIVAIVGANGAGKSTLVKLLCRFYDPDAGRIELDGVDIRTLSVEALRRLITVLFQIPVPYHTTVRENIAFGDLAAAPNAAAIEVAARGAGAHEVIARLPRGYDTLLGKWFADGVELSAGEWQRLALARAFLRQAQIVILDEPTSFMDSWAEADWLARFRTLVRGRTALIITHRFTTAICADVIHVMQDGQIVESGSHDDLLAQEGLYAQSWRAQMQASYGSADSDVGTKAKRNWPSLDGTLARP
jgi:ATP-binding cassette subfamily B protein